MELAEAKIWRPHLSCQNGHARIVQAADDPIHPTGMAGVKNQQLVKGFDLF